LRGRLRLKGRKEEAGCPRGRRLQPLPCKREAPLSLHLPVASINSGTSGVLGSDSGRAIRRAVGNRARGTLLLGRAWQAEGALRLPASEQATPAARPACFFMGPTLWAAQTAGTWLLCTAGGRRDDGRGIKRGGGGEGEEEEEQITPLHFTAPATPARQATPTTGKAPPAPHHPSHALCMPHHTCLPSAGCPSFGRKGTQVVGQAEQTWRKSRRHSSNRQIASANSLPPAAHTTCTPCRAFTCAAAANRLFRAAHHFTAQGTARLNADWRAWRRRRHAPYLPGQVRRPLPPRAPTCLPSGALCTLVGLRSKASVLLSHSSPGDAPLPCGTGCGQTVILVQWYLYSALLWRATASRGRRTRYTAKHYPTTPAAYHTFSFALPRRLPGALPARTRAPARLRLPHTTPTLPPAPFQRLACRLAWGDTSCMAFRQRSLADGRVWTRGKRRPACRACYCRGNKTFGAHSARLAGAGQAADAARSSHHQHSASGWAWRWRGTGGVRAGYRLWRPRWHSLGALASAAFINRRAHTTVSYLSTRRHAFKAFPAGGACLYARACLAHTSSCPSRQMVTCGAALRPPLLFCRSPHPAHLLRLFSDGWTALPLGGRPFDGASKRANTHLARWQPAERTGRGRAAQKACHGSTCVPFFADSAFQRVDTIQHSGA